MMATVGYWLLAKGSIFLKVRVCFCVRVMLFFLAEEGFENPFKKF